jgi:hypothetical protein
VKSLSTEKEERTSPSETANGQSFRAFRLRREKAIREGAMTTGTAIESNQPPEFLSKWRDFDSGWRSMTATPRTGKMPKPGAHEGSISHIDADKAHSIPQRMYQKLEALRSRIRVTQVPDRKNRTAATLRCSSGRRNHEVAHISS